MCFSEVFAPERHPSVNGKITINAGRSVANWEHINNLTTGKIAQYIISPHRSKNNDNTAVTQKGICGNPTIFEIVSETLHTLRRYLYQTQSPVVLTVHIIT